MNVALWILQVLLAVLCVSGGYFQMFKVEQLRLHSVSMRELPRALWTLFGAIGFVAGLALVLPGLFHVLPGLTAIAAVVVAVESALLTMVYVRYGDRAPLPYSITMTIVAVVIQYGRFVLRPL